MLKYEGTDKIRDIKYEDGYVDKIYYDNNTLLVFTSDKEKTGVDEVLFKGRKLIDVTSYGKCVQTNLPLGYTQLEYIESDGTQYINTGIVPTNDITLKVVFAFTGDTSSSRRVFGKILGSSAIALNYREAGSSFYWFGSINNSDITPDKQKHTIEFRTDGKVYRDNIEIGTKGTFGSGADNPIYLFAELTDGNVINYGQVKIYEWEVYSQGVLIQKLLPTKNSNNVVGMYDTVTNTFFTNAGTGDFIAGPDAVPTPDNPVDIVCNNGVLKIQGNLFNGNFDVGWGIEGSSGYIVSAAGRYSFYIPVEEGATYKITRSGIGTSSYFYYGTYTNEPYTSGQDCVTFGNIGTSTPSATITIPSGANYLAFFFGMGTPTGVIVEDLAKPYGTIYTDGTVETITDSLNNSATTETLLGVGDYKDEQDIISGSVVRNVGVKVFDGSELFDVVNNTFRYNLAGLLMNNKVICNYFDGNVEPSIMTSNQPDLTVKNNVSSNNFIYFKYAAKTTVEDFQQYLATQYSAGTPVIVVYPTSSPVTEQVVPQALNAQTGDNILEITQASVDDILLKVKYK